MTAVRVLGDAIPKVKDRLGDTFGATADVADEIPAGWQALTATVPLAVVDDDGGPVTWPVYGRPIVRVTIYANGKQTAKQIRGIALGAIMGAPIPGIALHSTGIGYTEARDNETGADLASFTVTATVPTEVITV